MNSPDTAALREIAREAVSIFEEIRDLEGIECIPNNDIQDRVRAFLSKANTAQALADSGLLGREGWRPIESVPERTDVLVSVTHSLGCDEWETVQWVDFYIDGIGWVIYRDRVDIPFPPSHWQPIPAPPEAAPPATPDQEGK